MTPRGMLLLGPNDWDDGFRPSIPDDLVLALGLTVAVPTPKQIRQALSKKIELESAGRWTGVVMDPSEQRQAEDDADFFQRLEKERKVEAYFFLVPIHGKMLGTTFEAGMLRRDFHHDKHPRIFFFLERGYLQPSTEGPGALAVKGKRTTYLASLLRLAEHTQEWTALEDCVQLVMRHATMFWTSQRR